MKKDKPKYYIASCSFGKDSLATILLALEHGEPLDEVVSVEVMFDNERGITGENPEHWDWVKRVAIPRLQSMGLKVTLLHSDYDYMRIFHKIRSSRSKYTGKKNGFFIGGKCQGNSLMKMRPLDRYKREMEKMYNVVYYVGIAKDEKKRLARLDGINNISLLDKYGYTEDMAKELCIKNNLLSPVYQITTRGGVGSAQTKATTNASNSERDTQTFGKNLRNLIRRKIGFLRISNMIKH